MNVETSLLVVMACESNTQQLNTQCISVTVLKHLRTVTDESHARDSIGCA